MMSGSTARRISLAATVLAGLGACSDGGTTHDAAIDTPPGACGAEATFTGEIVDWDSTDAKFCGVFQAKFTVRGDTARTSITAPNGRFQLCLAHQAQTVVEIEPPRDGSECVGLAGTQMNAYKLGGVAIASDAVIAAGGAYSARAMVEKRVLSMETQIGEALAADHGQLVVHVDGTPRAVSISAVHASPQRFDGAAWAAGDTGRDVLFPNVVTAAPVTVTVAGGAVGTGSYTIEPGKLTYLTVVVR